MRRRDRDDRGVKGIVDHLASCGDRSPDLRGLAEVIGRSVGARACALTVDGRRLTWGVAGTTWWGTAVQHGGEVQGALAVSPGSMGPLPGVAAAVGPLFAEARLAADADRLRRAGDAAVRELADGRWRAAAEMDRERRAAERDLHDGAQHHLVALRMSVALMEHAVATGDEEKARELPARFSARLDEAEQLVVRTASGILPVALVAKGLAPALAEELDGHDDVRLDVDPALRRYPGPAESAVFFVCLEAVSNARKHAPGAPIRVSLRETGAGLGFEVRDGGPGFGELPPDAGLHHLTSRMAAVGGTVRIASAPGKGTSVIGSVPR
ncbi:sensor histidine kinase [Saccharothrix yanglingensis]|uniref:sensor histidine kinase n=1 Tax=Saccharothrix yanglingensis TaxID=659496 RepID=UPI0027D2E197|nr:ATP-binding protein [Saccharothrix yanglingensis]